MAGSVGWWKLAIACALVCACQRLEYVDDEGEANDDDESDDDAGAEWNVPPNQEDDDVYIPNPVCFVDEVCECYGAVGQTLCDGFVREQCSPLVGCDMLESGALEDCVVGLFCDVGGDIDEGVLLCDPLDACAGACDLDPATCDTDGDGTPTFPCGAHQCQLGQFCVERGEGCSSSGDGFACVSPPQLCEGASFEEQRACVGDLACARGAESYWAHAIECNDECGE